MTPRGSVSYWTLHSSKVLLVDVCISHSLVGLRFNVFPREAQLQSCLTGLVEALLTPPTPDDPQDKTIAQKKCESTPSSLFLHPVPSLLLDISQFSIAYQQ